MNRNTDMANTVDPASANAREAYLAGRCLASVVAEAITAFQQRNPDLAATASRWSEYAGPSSTLWHCLRQAQPETAEKPVCAVCGAAVDPAEGSGAFDGKRFVCDRHLYQ